MTQRLKKQLHAYAVNTNSQLNKIGAFYLQALVEFLSSCALGDIEQARNSVLLCEDVALVDRVAFAATYLSGVELDVYLQGMSDALIGRGDLEGLVLLGLGPKGMPLIQQYLDDHDDLQTAALLVGHLASIEKDSAAARWLSEYRALLNRRGLYQDRANLDVQLGRRHRAATTGACEAGIVSKGPSMKRDMYRTHPFCEAPHVFLRCHYCSASLPSDATQKQTHMVWQKRQNNVMHCCSNCKKALPRCYVCLSHLGIVNPQIEFNRYMVQKRNVEVVEGGSEAPEHAALPLAHWFLFCQLCKHGGHAECIESWFGGARGVCGVNGCTCVCIR
jgi:hypothetical protein